MAVRVCPPSARPAPPEVSMGVSLGGGWLDLKIETAGIDPAELLQVLSEYRQKRNITA